MIVARDLCFLLWLYSSLSPSSAMARLSPDVKRCAGEARDWSCYTAQLNAVPFVFDDAALQELARPSSDEIALVDYSIVTLVLPDGTRRKIEVRSPAQASSSSLHDDENKKRKRVRSPNAPASPSPAAVHAGSQGGRRTQPSLPHPLPANSGVTRSRSPHRQILLPISQRLAQWTNKNQWRDAIPELLETFHQMYIHTSMARSFMVGATGQG